MICLLFIIVSVKWGREKFENVELDSDESPELFKAQLFALSAVPPERQKVMFKGSVLKVHWLPIQFIDAFFKRVNTIIDKSCEYLH